MKRPTKEQVQDRIVKAVIETVAQQGIGATSMALVARAAQVSAGTLYLHFTSKEDMLQQVYLRLKHAFHADLMSASAAPTHRDAICGMWWAVLEFHKKNPDGLLFLEYAGAAQVLTQEQKNQVAPLQDDVHAVLQRAIDDKAMTPPSLEVAVNLLIGPALHLARKYALTKERIPAPEAQQTFDRVWACLGGT